MTNLKCYRKPFQRQLDQGEKISEYESMPKDYANIKIVPSPKMRAPVSDKSVKLMYFQKNYKRDADDGYA